MACSPLTRVGYVWPRRCYRIAGAFVWVMVSLVISVNVFVFIWSYFVKLSASFRLNLVTTSAVCIPGLTPEIARPTSLQIKARTNRPAFGFSIWPPLLVDRCK